ncbi:hypothetical protein OG21DRAFT_1512779 [Imleria badia]|nr:hypothetical protein OG21DRAFT_1512779 [Imleria badia]
MTQPNSSALLFHVALVSRLTIECSRKGHEVVMVEKVNELKTQAHCQCAIQVIIAPSLKPRQSPDVTPRSIGQKRS